jgi:hypothetical protein
MQREKKYMTVRLLILSSDISDSKLIRVSSNGKKEKRDSGKHTCTSTDDE